MGRAKWLHRSTVAVAAASAFLACLERSDAQAPDAYLAHLGQGPATAVPEPRMWLAGSGPTATAREALATLRSAGEEGLDPADYGTGALLQVAGRIEAGDIPSEADLTAFDQRLTTAMVQYLHDVHRGRIEPPAVGFRLEVPDDRQDLQALLRDAIAARQLPALIQELRPQLKQYRRAAAGLDALPRDRGGLRTVSSAQGVGPSRRLVCRRSATPAATDCAR